MSRILAIDDAAVVRAIYRQYLRPLGGTTLSFAKNGAEALQSLEQDGEPDLIFLDVNMPEMDGLELLSVLAARGVLARVPVVIVSTESSPADVQRGLGSGAVGYLKKPFRPEELQELARRHLKSGHGARQSHGGTP